MPRPASDVGLELWHRVVSSTGPLERSACIDDPLPHRTAHTRELIVTPGFMPVPGIENWMSRHLLLRLHELAIPEMATCHRLKPNPRRCLLELV